MKKPEEVEEAEAVENIITAKDGSFTYRVIAYRKLSDIELQELVWSALQSGRLQEPRPGEVATLITTLGKWDNAYQSCRG